MVVLAVETVSRGGSLAIWQDGVCHAQRGDSSRTPAERLPGEALALLETRGLSLADVDLFAVVTGPGPFTGLRVGIAAVQGLTLASGRRAVGVPTLDALMTTWRLSHESDALVVGCLEGHRDDLFIAAVDVAAGRPFDECPVVLAPASVSAEQAVEQVVATARDRPRVVLVGDGAVRCARLFRERLPDAEIHPVSRPLAEAAATLAAERADQAVLPHALAAAYLRRPGVEVARGSTRGPAEDPSPGGACAIRRASTTADLEAVEALQRKTFTNPWGAEAIRWELENTDVARLYLLHEPGGAAVAYCACWVVFDELHINSLAVDPRWRRLGYARRLLRHVMAEAAANGASSATLEVRASNEAARRLYEGLGFHVEGLRRDYYRDPREDALILWNRSLAS